MKRSARELLTISFSKISFSMFAMEKCLGGDQGRPVRSRAREVASERARRGSGRVEVT